MSWRDTGVHVIIFLITTIGCSNPDNQDLILDVGQAIVTIENIEYEAVANMNSRILNDKEFEELSLIISDSVSINILKVNFMEETITWTGENLNPEGVIFYLLYNFISGSFNCPHDGYLLINARTDSTISGSFDMNLFDVTSSCSNCPEDHVSIEGQFIVGMN